MWQKKFLGPVLRHRYLTLLVVGLITVLAGFYAARVEMDNSIEIWFLEDDPAIVEYREFLDRFGADEVTVLGVFADDVFEPEVLNTVQRIARAAEQVKNVHSVVSVADVAVPVMRDDTLQIAPLFDQFPVSASEANAARAQVRQSSLVHGHLVAEDERATAILISLAPEGNDFESKTRLVYDLEQVVEREAGPNSKLRFSMAGSPPFDRAFAEHSQRDFRVLGPLAALLIVVGTYLIFRRLSATVVPLAVVGVALIWMNGVMGWLGLKVNVLTAGLGALVLAAGVAESLHVLTEYYRFLAAGHKPDEAVELAVTDLLVPCFFTSITTVAGMISLLYSPLAPLKEFGLLSSIGISFAFILTFTLLPSVLTMTKPPKPEFLDEHVTGRVARILKWFATPTRSRAQITLAGALALAGLAGYSLTHLTIGANPMNYFKADDPVSLATREIDARLGGSGTVEYAVSAPDGALTDPDVIRTVDRFERWMETRPGNAKILSYVDILKETKSLMAGVPITSALPESQAEAEQYFLLLQSDPNFGSWVQDDNSSARVTARIRMSALDDSENKVGRIEQEIRERFNSDKVTITMTGFVKLMGDMEHYLMQSQLQSFGAAFIMIALQMFLLLRSIKLGAFSLIPNVFPILYGLAFMVWMDIDLDPGTVMTASIALGLIVDDTVHFMYRIRHSLLHGATLEQAIENTMLETGKPILFTTALLAAGFAIMATGSFAPTVNFGLITAATIVIAFLSELLILPAALLIIRPKFGSNSDGES